MRRVRVRTHLASGLPEVFHGSQWVSLHRSLVHHIVQHPAAQSMVASFEHTLLPDEALLQTAATLGAAPPPSP